MRIRDDIQAHAKLAVLGPNAPGYVAGQIELTSRCFQACPMCDSWRPDADHGTLSQEQAHDVMIDLGYYACFKHLSLTGGDPLAWPPLGEILAGTWPFEIQLNTAMTYQPELDLSGVQDLRVSLDAATPETYYRMRGDKQDPEEIVNRVCRLRHRGVAYNITVTTRNVHELRDIFELILTTHDQRGAPMPRKIMALAVIGDRDRGKNKAEEEFWNRFTVAAAACEEAYRGRIASNIFGPTMENPRKTRDYLASGFGADVPCYAGSVTFHMKANGDLYPCCLVGGEALKVQNGFALGNVFTAEKEYPWLTGIETLRQHYEPGLFYRDLPDGQRSLCAEICQWKQLNLNLAAYRCRNDALAMP